VHVEGPLIARVCSAKIVRELRHGVLTGDLDENIVHVYGLSSVVFAFGLSIEGNLGKVAVLNDAAFYRRVRRLAFLQSLELILNILFGDGDFGVLGSEFLVPSNLDLRHDFETGLEMQTLAIMDMEIGDARLRYGAEPKALGFLPEVLGHEGVDDIVLNVLLEALSDNGGWNMAAAEAGDAGKFLVLLNESVGLANDFLGGNLNFDLPFRAFGSFGWTHGLPFQI
jgi:hypothetical protein